MRMDSKLASWTTAVLVLSLAISGLFSFERDAHDIDSGQTAEIMAEDPPHDIIHFLHTGDVTRYFSPQLSVLSYFDTELPLDLVGDGHSYTGQEQFAMQWYMYPPAASDLNLSGIDAVIWISGEVGTGQPNMAGSVEIYEVTAQNIQDLNFNGTLVGVRTIPSNTPIYTYPPSAPMLFPIALNHTFKANSTIRFVLTVNPGTSGGGVGSQYTNVTVYWDSYHRFDSRLVLRTQNPLTIESVATLDNEGTSKGGFIDEGNTTMFFSADVSNPYGGYDIQWVNLTVRMPDGSPVIGLDDVPMERVVGSDTAALCRFEVEWNYTGMPTGLYSYEIWAVDQSGLTYYSYFEQYVYYPYDELASGSFVIGTMYELAVHASDSVNADLVGARISFEGVESYTNDTGWANLKVFGNGTLTVFWHGLPVYESFVDVTVTSEVHAECAVYYPELIAVDSLALPLPAAAVFFTYPDGEGIPAIVTDGDGSAGVIVQVPAGESMVSIWWRGELVYDGPVTIDHNGDVAILCTVFYLGVSVTDWAGTPVTMATVVWIDSDSHILIDSKFVNETGCAVARLPDGSYDIEVYWHGNMIVTADNVSLETNMDIVLIGHVCSVDIIAVDAAGIALPETHIVVSSGSGIIVSQLTDETGVMHAILPVGTVTIEAYWLGALVNESAIVLEDNATITLDCAVSYLTVNTVDKDGNALSDVEVVVFDSEANAIAYGLTVDGEIGFRLPDQSVTVQGHLVDVYMMTRVSMYTEMQIEVSGDAHVVLEFNDYPPSVLSTALFSYSLLGAILAVFAAATVYLLVLKPRKNGKIGDGEQPQRQE